jgi:phenylacetic acid degradation operon negative regulatory protein
VWIAPFRSHGYAERIIDELELARYAAVFGGSYVGVEEIEGFVGRAWNFERLSARYSGFIDQHAEVAARWSDGRRKLGSREAFVDYLMTLNAWRSIPFLDPGLPTELLPDNWRGEEAISLFQTIERTLNERAFEHVLATIERRSPQAHPHATNGNPRHPAHTTP